MKKVLHIGLIAPGYSNAGLMKAFFSNGFTEYTLFDFQLKMFEFGKETMRQMLIQEVERVKPNLVFGQIQSSEILDEATFVRLSEIAFTVNYTFDIRTVEQTEWLYNIVPVIGLSCFSNKRDVDECTRRGYSNTMALHSSIDMDVYVPGDVKRHGVVFIGNNYLNTSLDFPLKTERAAMVEFLDKTLGDQFETHGINWGHGGMVTSYKEIKIYQSALIAISQNNFDEVLYTSDRIWRAMACGTLCLTKYFIGIETIFTRGEHLDWWESFDELADKIDFYLSNPVVAMEIAEKGNKHVRDNHTWTLRVKEMMDMVSYLKDVWVYDTNTRIKDGCVKAGAHVIDGIIPGPFDEHLKDRACDCGKIRYLWQECGCTLKEWQLRAQENI